MSFREDMSAVALCNRALSRLAQGPISSLDPPSPSGLASRECARWYRPVVARLIEMHHWGLATSRIPLTATTNDRSDWLYKFALPNQVAFPVSLAMSGTTGAMTYYQGLAGLLATIGSTPMFLMSGRNLYSRISGDLDFVSYDITEADFNSTFANIVDLMLAAAMAPAIIKNSLRKEQDLRQQATAAINLAIAQNLNTGHPTYGDGPSARDYARGTFFGMNWDWWPGPPA
jgi:hypothetical protein